MSKPSIGSAMTAAQEQEKRRIIKELTVLEEHSKESIFSLIFSETENRSLVENEP